MDSSRIAMLAYMNSAFDYIALYLDQILQHHHYHSFKHSNHSNHLNPWNDKIVCFSLQETSWKISSFADEILFFLRREIRLHCFYYLTQLISKRFDQQEKEEITLMAQDVVLFLNINLSTIEHAIQPYFSSHKMAFMFDALDALLSNILIKNLEQMHGIFMTKTGVQQMLLNISSLHQGLTGMLYSYPMTGRTGIYFDHAKRYYQLLLLNETQLEMFVIENKKAYTPEAFRALWRVNTPHRVLTQGSINKLDSNLR
jgi:exocyst complex component 4